MAYQHRHSQMAAQALKINKPPGALTAAIVCESFVRCRPPLVYPLI